MNSTSQLFHNVGMANTTGHFTRSADSYMLPVYLGGGGRGLGFRGSGWLSRILSNLGLLPLVFEHLPPPPLKPKAQTLNHTLISNMCPNVCSVEYSILGVNLLWHVEHHDHHLEEQIEERTVLPRGEGQSVALATGFLPRPKCLLLLA